MRTRLGGPFGWLWAAHAMSASGTWLAFGAFPLIAILVLDAGPTRVSLLAAAGLTVGALAAVPLGPWVEVHRKRPVLVAADLARFGALASVPVAFWLGWLSYLHLVAVSVVVAAADITFRAAGGAYLKALVRPEHLLTANSRLESTTWAATVVGPPLGGVAVGLFGPVLTVAADAVSHLLSALGIGAVRAAEETPARHRYPARPGWREVSEGWRYLLTHPGLRPLFLHTILVNALIMATSPLLAVLMLDHLAFAPWQYGLAFALPCVGALVGARLAPPLVARFGQRAVLLTSGTLRVCWPVALALTPSGTGGLVFVIAVQCALMTCTGVFNPVYATHRLEQIPADRLTRTLTAWSVSGKATVAALTCLWGLLASVTSLRAAVAIAGLALLAAPLPLLRSARARQDETPAPHTPR